MPVLRHDADAALWVALGTHPGSTAAALADVAGIGPATARRALSGWEIAGAARSHCDPESRRAPKTWTRADVATPKQAALPEPAATQQFTPAEVDAQAPEIPAPTGDTGAA